MIDAAGIEDGLRRKLGVDFQVDLGKRGDAENVSIRPVGLNDGEGFTVDVAWHWARVEASFQPEARGGRLMRLMSGADDTARATFRALLDGVTTSGLKLEILNGGERLSHHEMESWPEVWNGLRIHVSCRPADILRNGETRTQATVRLLTSLTGAILSLLPLEAREDPPVGLVVEGKPRLAYVTTYERSAVNRAACIAARGDKCLACGFDFGKVYGAAGTGFIEVHHAIMVSQMGGGRLVDPTRDLVPLCSNCHSITHRRDPPYTLDELREMMGKAGHM